MTCVIVIVAVVDSWVWTISAVAAVVAAVEDACRSVV